MTPTNGRTQMKVTQPAFAHPPRSRLRNTSAMSQNSRNNHSIHRQKNIIVRNAFHSGYDIRHLPTPGTPTGVRSSREPRFAGPATTSLDPGEAAINRLARPAGSAAHAGGARQP